MKSFVKAAALALMGVFLFSSVCFGQETEPEPVPANEMPADSDTETPEKVYTGTPYFCPVMKSEIGARGDAGGFAELRGVRYYFCCEECITEFAKYPDKWAKTGLGKQLIGDALFDAVSTERVTKANVAASSDYKGVRYYFTSKENKQLFDKNPIRYSAAPVQEMLYSPVSDTRIASYTDASNYSDYKGVRYYFANAGDKTTFEKEPDKYVSKLKMKPVNPGAVPAPKTEPAKPAKKS